MIVEEWRDVEPENALALVGCGASKQKRSTEAGDMYTSGYFKCKWGAAAHVGDRMVLSAKHGLLEPGEIIKPYDLTMSQLTDEERKQWGQGVMEDLPGGYDQVWIFSGKLYIEPILDGLEERVDQVVLPFAKTSGIGEQQSEANTIKIKHNPNSLI